jgi:transposase
MTQKVDQPIGTAKFMLIDIWGVNSFHLLDSIRSEGRFNAQYFVEHVVVPLAQMVFPQGMTRDTPRLNIRLDNYPVHLSKVTEQFFIENQLLHLPHPPYSPDLAPSGLWLFGCIKTGLAGRCFADPEELVEGVGEFLEGISASELTAVFEGWIDRLRWLIAHNGQSYSS